MTWLRNIPMATFATAGAIVVAIAWVTMDGTVPLVISIIYGGLIAVKGTLGEAGGE